MLSDDELDRERGLVEAAQRDPACFEPLYDRYLDRVYAFALVRTGDRQAAEDITSETFLRALRYLPKFQWRNRPLWTWLCAIAAHLSVNLHQKSARGVSLEGLDEELATCLRDDLREAEKRVRLYALVDRLPALQHRVITMRFGEDLSIKQTATILERSEGAVKQLQRRAILSLRAWVGENDD